MSGRGAARARQGDLLPSSPCALSVVPVGACVRIAYPALCEECNGAAQWYQVTFAIGTLTNGTRNLRALIYPPSDPMCLESPDHCHMVAPTVRVLELGWPARLTDEASRDAVLDPISGALRGLPLFGGR